MIRILIVDDEKLERNGIKFLLKREPGEYQVLEAENGREALGLLQTEQVDILLSDVKMPYMNGLELSKHVREQYPDLPIIIFSGYNDFSYAREAIRYGVLDYVLKPVDPQEFHKTLEKVVSHITTRQEREEKQSRREDYLKKFFLLNYLYNGREEELESAAQLVQLKRDTLNQYSRMILAGSTGNFFEIEEETFQEELRGKIQRNFYYVNLNSNESLFFFKEKSCDYRRLALTLHNFFRQKYDADCYFAVSTELENYRELPQLLPQLEQLLEEHFYEPEVHVFSMEAKGDEEDSAQVEDAKVLQNILDDIHHKDTVHLWQNFRRIEKKYRTDKQFSEMYVKFVFSSILKELYDTMMASGEKGLSREVDRLYRCRTIQEVLEITEQAIREFEEHLKEQNHGFRDEVTKVKSYIYHHYEEELSAEMLAAKVCLSPGYLSHVFKQETGVNLNRFIRECRMKKAKELLETTNLKIVQIARQVGFSNNSYFCKSFREYFGDTPESCRKGWPEDEENTEKS